MNLAIDFGNSADKAGIFSGEELIQVHLLQELGKHFELSEFDNIIYSDVSGAGETWEREHPDFNNIYKVTYQFPLPISLVYGTPETLGVDRICAAAGAQGYFPDEDILVIDAGTCITADLLRSNGSFIGGSISPGIGMRLKSMHHFTARLPNVTLRMPQAYLGDSTENSMLSGAIYGARYEIQGIIERFQADFPGIRVIFTGGDRNFFESSLKEPIFAVSNLVLQGLNRILIHNVVK